MSSASLALSLRCALPGQAGRDTGAQPSKITAVGVHHERATGRTRREGDHPTVGGPDRTRLETAAAVRAIQTLQVRAVDVHRPDLDPEMHRPSGCPEEDELAAVRRPRRIRRDDAGAVSAREIDALIAEAACTGDRE